jgi:hypothetical protein
MPEPACKFREIRWMPDREVQSIKERMVKKQRILRSKSRKQYWGVLAPDPAYKTFRKTNNFMSLLQAQYQNAEGVPVSARDRVPGKDKPDQPSEDITV